MVGSLGRAKEIYHRKGALTLISKVSIFLLNRIAYLPLLDNIAFYLSVRKLTSRMEREENLNDILNTAFEFRGYGRYYSLRPLQIRSEFKVLVESVAEDQPERVMEIGTANGGSLYTWCRCLDNTSQVISLDLPRGKYGGGYTSKKTQFFQEFSKDKELNFIRANSHLEDTLEATKDILEGEKIDFLFIDGDHRYEGVKQDFEMYSPLVKEGGLIVFHDIVDGPKPKVGGVPEFWRELEDSFETERIIAEESEREGFGIGILRK